MEDSKMPAELAEYIRKEAEKEGFQLVDISTKGGSSFFMEILLDKENGITLDECGLFNRKVSSWIEEKNLFGDSFTIEVCSPGLDRPLKKTGDFLWARGKLVQVKVHEPLAGKSTVTGELTGISGEGDITIREEDGDEVLVSRDNIAGAKLWLPSDKKKKQRNP